jgi:chromosomal replication initiator protein
VEHRPTFRVVVASPGDVAAERKALQEVVTELNLTAAPHLGCQIVLCRWETDAHPGFHIEGPQALIDSILRIEECDVFVGIFWMRFGTPVSDGRSGTEHEFRRAYQSWRRRGRPQILFYFNEKPYVLRTEQDVQHVGRIIKFRSEFPSEGLWWTYRGTQNFKDLLRQHLTTVLRTLNSSLASGHGNTEMGHASRNATVDSAAPILNPRFSFDTFVVGACNQLAHIAARAVAAAPARSYNPLFVHGGVGLGKTHLLHSIAREVIQMNRPARVVCTSAERLKLEMIDCIKRDQMSAFYERYRAVDVLIVDDVQFLAGKEHTQQEFCHLFSDLYDRQKQVVLSADVPLCRISHLAAPLQACLSGGLAVELQSPDLETKVAIASRRAVAEGIEIPQDVHILLAINTGSSIRELEGALNKLFVFQSIARSPITLDTARRVLRDLADRQLRKVKIRDVIEAVAADFDLEPEQLKTKTNESSIATARAIAMYLIKELTSASLPEIGKAFGGKHHTTVLHSITGIEVKRQADVGLNAALHRIIDRLNG